MVGIGIDGSSRDRVMVLIQEKDRIESEIRDQNAILETNHVGLQNDHKNLMKQIERGLAEVHADLLGSNGEGTSSRNGQSNGHANGHSSHMNSYASMNGHAATNGHSSGDVDMESRPFGIIRFVHDGSPADLGGLMTNDEVLEFGTVNKDNFRDIFQIQDIVAHSVGQRVNVKVKRGNSVVNLTIVPRQWAQRGLLGCQIDALT